MSFLCLLAWFDKLFCAFINDSYAYFYINYIASKIFRAFFLLICLQVVLSEKSTKSKLIHRYKLFKIKNKDNLVKAELLFFTANFAIGSLFNQSFCL